MGTTNILDWAIPAGAHEVAGCRHLLSYQLICPSMSLAYLSPPSYEIKYIYRHCHVSPGIMTPDKEQGTKTIQ